uniref:DAZ-associated protein 2 n=1 Tax=Sinocyclocheilus grahami TaxID=75366 RepID=A0A672MGG5_SINGR
MNNKGSYPQAVYPQQSTAPVYPPAMQVPPQVSPYADAPPPYSEVYQARYMAPPPAHGQMAPMTSAYPGTQMYMPMHAQSVPMGAMAPSVPMAYYQMGPMYPHGSTVMVEGGFDAGARFGPSTSTSIPILSSEWVPSEREFKQPIKTSQYSTSNAHDSSPSIVL